MYFQLGVKCHRRPMLWVSGGSKPTKGPPQLLGGLMRAHSLFKCHESSAEWCSFKGQN